MDAQSSFHKVYVAAGRTSDGKEYTKVGFSCQPKRRLKRFGKRYGVDCEFVGCANFHVPTRALAYALEQAILHRCRLKSFESIGAELFITPPGEIIRIGFALHRAFFQ